MPPAIPPIPCCGSGGVDCAQDKPGMRKNAIKRPSNLSRAGNIKNPPSVGVYRNPHSVDALFDVTIMRSGTYAPHRLIARGHPLGVLSESVLQLRCRQLQSDGINQTGSFYLRSSLNKEVRAINFG